MSKRITKHTPRDLEKTKELDLYELDVIEYKESVLLTNRGDSRGPFFAVVDKEDLKPCCPVCGAVGENHQRYEKTYKDCIQNEDGQYVECLVKHYFVKYICYGHKPNSLFSREYDFADSNYNVTRRLENRILDIAMKKSVSIVPFVVNNILTKQSVAEIVNRWVDEADIARGGFPDTGRLIVMSCTRDSEGYAYIASDSFGGLKILDVIYFTTSSDIIEELRKFDLSKVNIILSDVNPTIREAVHGYVSEDINVVMDIASLREWIEFEIMQNLKKYAKQIGITLKNDLVAVSSRPDGTWLANQREEVLSKRPKLSRFYSHINLLREILNSNEDIVEENLYQWTQSIPAEVLPELKDIADAVEFSFEEIINFYRRRTSVSEDTYKKIKGLHDKLQHWKNSKNHNLMRARVLYASYIDNREDLAEDQWYGVNYEDVMENINKLIQGD